MNIPNEILAILLSFIGALLGVVFMFIMYEVRKSREVLHDIEVIISDIRERLTVLEVKTETSEKLRSVR